MLFKSNKFFDLKSKKNSETSYPKIDITENICDHTVEYWQLSINLCHFFNFLLHITGKSCHVLRFNYLEMCYFLVYVLISVRVPHSGGHGVTPAPLILRFFSKTSPIKFWGAPPHVWNTCGKPCICETQVHNSTENVIFGIPHSKVLWQAHLFTFSN